MEIAVTFVFFIIALLRVILILLYAIGILFEITILQGFFYFIYRFFTGLGKVIYDLLRMLFSRTGTSAKASSSASSDAHETPSVVLPDTEIKNDVPRCQCGAALPYAGAYCSWCGRGKTDKEKSTKQT